MARNRTSASGGQNSIPAPASGNTVRVEVGDELEVGVGAVLQHLQMFKYQ